MTVKDVLQQVENVRHLKHDPEAAHCLEDELWDNVLMAIAGDIGANPQELAKAALKTKEIDFPRWCA